MKYCKNCGKQINDDSKFCTSCGTQAAVQEINQHIPVTQGYSKANKRLRCPQCGSVRFSPVVESTNNGGVAVSNAVTRRTAVTSYSSNTTHRNYWLCQDCGTKFRNIQNLKEEIASVTKLKNVFFVLSIITAVWCLFLFFMLEMESEVLFLLAPAIFVFVVFFLICFGIWLSSKFKLNKMNAEKKYLEENCFSK